MFAFDVKTTLNISDVTFYPSQTTHSYDIYASANDKEDILFLNLLTGKGKKYPYTLSLFINDFVLGKVEIITGVGKAISSKLAKWGNPVRPIKGSGEVLLKRINGRAKIGF